MAYGTKYRHSFCNKFGKTCRIDILEEDYAGIVIEVDAGPSPVVIDHESSSDDKFDPIRASTATVTLIGSEAFEMEWLWTADERKYRVESWIDGALDWRGYIIPNGFRHEYTGGYYYATITASDGLSTLKGVKFVSESGETYNLVDLTFNDGSRYPFILIATEILRKLDLDLNLWTCVDVYEERMQKTGGREGDPLANSNVDVRTYINDTQRDDIPYWQDIGGVFDCERVLRNLLKIWGAKVYQQGGAWKIKRINADAVATPRFWRKYNTAAVYIGIEEITDNIIGKCDNSDLTFINGGHTMAMDRVYGQVAVLYKYTFLREGDSPVNLFKNGNFVWNPAFLSPPYWKRNNNMYVERATGVAPCAPTGICTAVDIFGANQYDMPTEDAALESTHIYVSQGDNILFKWWERVPQVNGRPTFGLYTIACTDGKYENWHYLVNDGVGGQAKSKWVNSPSEILYFKGTANLNVIELAANDWWREVNIEVPPAPINGDFLIRIHGLGSMYVVYSMVGNVPSSQVSFKGYAVVPGSNPPTMGETTFWSVANTYAHLTVTGFFAGLIKNVSSEEIATLHRYLSPLAPRPNYTDRPDPVEVLNGDAVDVDHVSSIQVPGVPGKLFWNTLDLKYKYSSIGLILAESILDQYHKPNRILEGDFLSEDMNFSSRITLDYLPNVRFIVQRGSWDVMACRWIGATLIQVTDDPFDEDGSDDGNTIDPIWEDTGSTRCVKVNGLNTGAVEKQQQDINPSSNTYGDLRWVPAGTDATKCPIGEPDAYLWGAEPASYNPDNFISNPFTLQGNEVRVAFDNSGGKYLFFLHLDTLGLVTSIIDGFGSETISDWQYLADTVIGGHNYKVLRMNYVTAIFTGLPMTFIFT